MTSKGCYSRDKAAKTAKLSVSFSPRLLSFKYFYPTNAKLDDIQVNFALYVTLCLSRIDGDVLKLNLVSRAFFKS